MGKKIKAGVIGLGVGEVHAKGYLACPEAELVADMSSSYAARERAAITSDVIVMPGSERRS